ncbi:metallophosphoesterase [Methanolobus zinderi]|uniref:DNA double-strand break repair protein Mre11 n=1 Tax=Methanolobus zinderi TaxID=536044 RepID=A0A7D5JAB6_9EURY|nr:exonuclease SbcCD subunit D [Methanolobus zinderi]QLC51150.1 metallophosphoesterase [Methanolobus zinderi]
MDEIRIIHTGDTHLGYRQYHSEVRRQDFMDAFSRVIDDAIEMEVDAVVHAGDLFDSRNPTLDDILGTMELFSRLRNAGIPLLAIVGNHESKQDTQWLDLYASMGLVVRLGATPFLLGDVAIYGIDCVPKSRIPLFDYSVFDGKATDAGYNLLVMHQLMKPFAFGEWDMHEVLDAVPFDVDAVLLGDNHKHEIIKVDDTWVTYCGSTERNSTSEKEPRSYNIVSVSDAGVDISRRIIRTRDFVFIPVTLENDVDAYNEIFSAIKEYDVEDKVVFVNISGEPAAKVTFSEIEKFLLSRNALVPGIKDLRTGEISLDDAQVPVSFADPDDAVKEEIKKMHLTQGGLLVDEIVRDPSVVKTKVDAEVEKRVGDLLESTDFSEHVIVRSVPEEAVKAVEVIPDTQVHVGDVDVPVRVSEDAANAGDVPAGEAAAGQKAVTSAEVRAEDTPEQIPEKVQEKEISVTENVDEVSDNDIPVDDREQEKAKEKTKDRSSTKKSSSPEKETEHKPRQYNLGDYL